MKRVAICPTLACASYLDLREELEILDAAGIDSYHIDIMDGSYVPNYCLNFDYIKAVRNVSKKSIDVHLMTTWTERDARLSIECGATAVAVHIDSNDVFKVLEMIRNLGAKAGVVLNPDQNVEELAPFLDKVDYVILMAVVPGFSGQSFKEETYTRLTLLDKMRRESALDFSILVDGGIDEANAPQCVSCGADALVAGALCIFSRKVGLEEATASFKRVLGRD